MAYEEYDYYNDQAGESKSLKESLYEILNGLKSEKNLRETGEAIKRVRDIAPNVAESLVRGGIGQAIGTSGDLRELRNTINSYLPKSVRNMTQAAEFLANPYATAIQQTAPTTEETLEFVPRATDKYEGYKQHETLGEYIAPSLGYFGGKALRAGKDMPAGLSIIGPESKIWDKEMAFTAGKLEAKGATPDEILEKTGMVRGLDNQWRSEISDLPAKMKQGETFGEIHRRGSLNGIWAKDKTTVKDVLEHPQLFEAYPHLGDVEIRPHGVDIPARGSYNQNKNLITLREDLIPQEAKSVILHELTHGVQGEEGLNRGASAAQLTRFYEEKQKALLPKIAELSDQMREANMAGDMDKYRQIMAERDALSREYTSINPEEMGYEDYFKHAGEAEARMVQRRMDLSPEELRKNYPYQYTGEQGYGLDINPDEAIITTKTPGTINMPEQSIEPPKSKQDELGFHSALENAIFGIKQPKGTGDQILKQLEKTPGVKTEELEVTGLKKYLQDNKFVTKQEIQDFMEQNRLKLENKILDEGSGQGNTYEDYQLQGGDVYHDDEYIRSLADDFHYDLKSDPDLFQAEKDALLERYPDLYEGHDTNPYMEARLNQDVEDALWEQAKQQAETMYYDDPIRHYYDEHGYDIYGNDNMGYSIKDPNGRFLSDLGDHYDISDAENALRSHLLDEGILGLDNEGAAKYADYVLPGRHENYREVLTTLPQKNVKDFDYSSGHFDEPNILAHMRVNDRTINGKRTLMVEEVQSDWHQAGRKKGYKGPDFAEKEAEIKKELGYVADQKRALIKEKEGQIDDKEVYEQLKAKIDELEKKSDEIRNRWRDLGDVPDAPYKKNWHELMVKQALDMAAKGDYDAIAFTTGKQQNARYNLSNYIESLSYNPETNQLWAYKKGEHRPMIDKTVEPDKLSEYVGEEVAKKLLTRELESVPTNNGVVQLQKLSGLDLETGGEGMKGFYDKIIPDYINKYTKKWGMGMKKGNLKGKPGASQEEVNAALKEFGVTKEEFDKLPIDKRVEILNAAQPKGEEVHFVELSDAAKKDIKEKGQPMFAGIGALGGVDYLAGSDEQNKLGIFKDLQKAKK